MNRNAASSTGASKSSSKTYEMDDGHVDSVSRDVQATNSRGQTAEWEGKAERSGYGVEFEGSGTNRYGQKVEAEGYGARGPYGSGVVADVEGGRYGDRTVVAGRAYGGPVYAASLPYGARPYSYHGHSYYTHGGIYYNTYHYHGAVYYGTMWPPWGVYYTTVPVGVDSGWKDTVLVWPGERVKIAMMFEPYEGMYMYHCHILEHEDMTMMRNYMIMEHDEMPM